MLAHQVASFCSPPAAGKTTSRTDPLGLFDRGLGDVKKNCDLAGDPLEVVQQLLLDRLLGAYADLVDDLDEQIDEAVGHLTLAQPAQRRDERGALL